MIYGALTYGTINSQLQAGLNNACLYGVDVISKLNQGLGCKKEKKTAQRILDLVDAINIYGAGSIIPPTAAKCIYSTAGWSGGSATFSLTITFNFKVFGSLSFTAISQSTIAGAFNALVYIINTTAGSIICNYDSTNHQFIMYYPVAGSIGNVGTMTFTASGGGAPTITPSSGNFSGGTDGNANTTINTNVCLLTNQIESILDKLTSLSVNTCSLSDYYSTPYGAG